MIVCSCETHIPTGRRSVLFAHGVASHEVENLAPSTLTVCAGNESDMVGGRRGPRFNRRLALRLISLDTCHVLLASAVPRVRCDV